MAPRTSLGANPTVVPASTTAYAISTNDNGRTFITSGGDKNSVVEFTLPPTNFEGFRLRIGVGRTGRPARIVSRDTIAFPRRSSLTTLDATDASHEGDMSIISRDPGAFIDLVWGPLDDNYWHVTGGAGLWVHEEDETSEFHLADLPSAGKMDFGKPAGTTSAWVSIPLFTPYKVSP